MKQARGTVVSTIFWIAIVFAIAVPVGAAAMSPFLAWRDPIYIVAGFAGVIALALLLLQPLLAVGYLPGLTAYGGRRVHRWSGGVLCLLVVIHVVGLWVTSPPDVVDALLFVSATPFSIWGVVSMWCVFAAACLVLFRGKLRLQPRTWRLTHRVLVAVIVTGSVIHALLIEGTMETLSKAMLCALVSGATLFVLIKLSSQK